MKVLYVVPYTPNLIRVRPYNLIRELSRRGHQITLATLWTDESERNEIDLLGEELYQLEATYLSRWRSYWNCLAALPTRTPLQAVYCWEPVLASRMDTLLDHPATLGGFDIVHVEHLRGARYGLRIRQRHPDLPVVWDSVDCISLLFKQAAGHSKRKVSRLVSSFELQRNHAYEGWLPGLFNHTLVTSQLDLQAFRDLIKQNRHTPRISVLPNGVDLDYFQPDETRQRQADTLVICGKMSYHANVTMVLNFVAQILPHIQAARPEVKLWVVGKDPAREIQALGNRSDIIVTGTVDDLRPYLQQAAVAVSPVIYGAGIRNKVLEAMACGTPVVSTPQAVSALNPKAGEDVLIGQDPGDFAALVINLLAEPYYQRESCRGRKRAQISRHGVLKRPAPAGQWRPPTL